MPTLGGTALKQSAKIIHFKNKRGSKNPAKSFQQLRQRELAWALYITEGYKSNLAHLLAVNCVTFTRSDKTAIKKVLESIEIDCGRLRDLMRNIS